MCVCVCIDVGHFFSLYLYPSVQRQVQGVMGIMKDNISKVLDRGEKLTDLQEKSGECHVLSPFEPCD